MMPWTWEGIRHRWKELEIEDSGELEWAKEREKWCNYILSKTIHLFPTNTLLSLSLSFFFLFFSSTLLFTLVCVMVSLCISDWTWISDPPALVSWVIRLHASESIPYYSVFLLNDWHKRKIYLIEELLGKEGDQWEWARDAIEQIWSKYIINIYENIIMNISIMFSYCMIIKYFLKIP